jgi:hypothetical protein
MSITTIGVLLIISYYVFGRSFYNYGRLEREHQMIKEGLKNGVVRDEGVERPITDEDINSGCFDSVLNKFKLPMLKCKVELIICVIIFGVLLNLLIFKESFNQG